MMLESAAFIPVMAADVCVPLAVRDATDASSSSMLMPADAAVGIT